MSWHYLRGQEEESWEGSCLDGAPSALLSMLPHQEKCCSHGNAMDVSNASQYGMMSEHSTENRGEARSMSSAADSRAKTSVAQEKAQESTGNEAVCGKSSPESLAKYDPPTHSLRTRQCLLFEDSTELFVTLPRWGMIRRGECFPLVKLAHDMSVKGCFALATPTKTQNFKPILRPTPSMRAGKHGETLPCSVGRLYPELIGNFISPEFCEVLMAWPPSWTDTKPLATDKIRMWLNSHGVPSQEVNDATAN